MKGTIEMSAVTIGMKTEMKGTTATMKSPKEEDDDESQPTQEEHEGPDSNTELNRSADSQAGRMYPQRRNEVFNIELMG